VSTTCTERAASGPSLVTVIVYVSASPAVIAGGPETVARRSAEETTVFVEASSFSVLGSLAPVETVTRLNSSSPLGVSGGMCTTRVNAWVAPAGSDGCVQSAVPPLPTAGVVQLQPAGASSETNVVAPGSGSVTVASAAAGPPLVIVIA
jgi:hypothetical protein